MLPPSIDFSLPTRVICAVDATGERLGKKIAGGLRGQSRALLVTDPGVERVGLAERVRAGLEGSPITVAASFAEVPQDSDVGAIETAAAAAKAEGCDFIIAVGGGSVIDTSKGAAILLAHGGSIRDYPGVNAVPGPIAPLVAIPTTAGTGSEVSPFAVVKDHEAKQKMHIVSRHLYARLAILDPEMTRTLPPRLTAATGADALSHAVEAYCSPIAHPITDALALGAAREIMAWLPKAVEDGEDTEARRRMALASHMAGAAMGVASVGVVHALAHALGGRHGIHHGVANALFLTAGIRYNAEAVPERIATLAEVIAGERGHDDPTGALLAAIDVLLDRIGVPRRLGEVEVGEDAFEAIAAAAAVDGAMFTNPRPASPSELLGLLRAVK